MGKNVWQSLYGNFCMGALHSNFCMVKILVIFCVDYIIFFVCIEKHTNIFFVWQFFVCENT